MHPFSHYASHMMLAQRKPQHETGWDSPKFMIDCVLTNVSRQLHADGCVLERLETGCRISTPDHLRIGDFVKVQLWLEGEEAFIDIRLAEVRNIYEHRIGVEVIQVSLNDRGKLKRFIGAPTGVHNIEEAVRINHLLIRA